MNGQQNNCYTGGFHRARISSAQLHAPWLFPFDLATGILHRYLCQTLPPGSANGPSRRGNFRIDRGRLGGTLTAGGCNRKGIKIPVKSTIKFTVKASVPNQRWFSISGMPFLSTPRTTWRTVFWTVKIQAADVNTGSGLKDDKLKSKDFFDVEQDPISRFTAWAASQSSWA